MKLTKTDNLTKQLQFSNKVEQETKGKIDQPIDSSGINQQEVFTQGEEISNQGPAKKWSIYDYIYSTDPVKIDYPDENIIPEPLTTEQIMEHTTKTVQGYKLNRCSNFLKSPLDIKPVMEARDRFAFDLIRTTDKESLQQAVEKQKLNSYKQNYFQEMSDFAEDLYDNTSDEKVKESAKKLLNALDRQDLTKHPFANIKFGQNLNKIFQEIANTQGKKIDFLGFDACLKAEEEVLRELTQPVDDKLSSKEVMAKVLPEHNELKFLFPESSKKDVISFGVLRNELADAILNGAEKGSYGPILTDDKRESMEKFLDKDNFEHPSNDFRYLDKLSASLIENSSDEKVKEAAMKLRDNISRNFIENSINPIKSETPHEINNPETEEFYHSLSNLSGLEKDETLTNASKKLARALKSFANTYAYGGPHSKKTLNKTTLKDMEDIKKSLKETEMLYGQWTPTADLRYLDIFSTSLIKNVSNEKIKEAAMDLRDTIKHRTNDQKSE